MNRHQLLRYLTGLPEVEQRETWGHPTFRVRSKIFASLPDGDTVVIKTSRPEQQALIAEDPDTFAEAPRVGRYGWVSARTERIADRQLRELVHQAWTRTAPKKLVADASR